MHPWLQKKRLDDGVFRPLPDTVEKFADTLYAVDAQQF